MLRRGGIDDRQIAGFESAEFTHTAVAAYIASGMADAGFAAEPAARQFRLAFLPLIEERCFLACRIDAINTVQIKALCKTLQSDPFRARLSGLPGNSTHACGAILSLADVFPQLGIRSGRLSRLRRA